MRRRGSPPAPPSPYRALAHHQASHGTNQSPSSLIRSFDSDSNPSRPIRPSPLAASPIPDLPLDLLERIRAFPLFMSAPDSFLAAIGAHLRPQINSAHDHILTEGDDAKAMYWVVRGVVAVTSRDGEAVYAELKPGAFFGEIGVLMNIPRTATIIARTKCMLVVLKKEDLAAELPRYPDMEKAIRQEAQERLMILKKKQQERGYGGRLLDKPPSKNREAAPGEVATGEVGVISEGAVINSKKRKSPSPGVIEDPSVGGSALGSGFVNIRKTLKELPLFSTLPPDILHFLGLSAQPKTYPPFTDVIRQGTPGNEIYFIVRGEAEVVHELRAKERRATRSSFARPRLVQGQYFGEVASLGLSPGRTATVKAITAVECLVIPGEALDELWRRCPPELKGQVEATARQRYSSKTQEDDDVEMRDPDEDDEVDPMTPSTPRRHSTPQVTFTTPSKPASPAKEEESRTPGDPDPFLSVDMENLRSRRRSSLAPPTPESASLPMNGVRPAGSSPFDSSPLKMFQFPPPSPQDERGPPKRARTLPRRPRSAKTGSAALPDEVLVRVFQHLEFLDLVRAAGAGTHWRKLATTSEKLCRVLDLSGYNRKINDWSLANVIAPFVGERPVEVDISNCFHISDEGFSALWKGCAKNVRVWRMRSVWDVSANQILDMAEHAANLEEVEWSNCRKVGDNLLARVVGWVVPEPAQKNVVISSSRRPAKAADRQAPAPGTVIGCPNLRRLDLSYCKHVTDRSMAHLAAHASARLQRLSLTRCTSISDAGFQSWANFRFNSLSHLRLADCTYLSDNAVVALVNAAKNLTHLDLSFCCALSDTATEVVALGLPRLKELRLAFCGSAVSDASLGCIALHLNDLRGLSVRGCVRVTGVGVENVLEGCGRLEWIDVSQCKNLKEWLARGGVGRWGRDDRGKDGQATVESNMAKVERNASGQPGFGGPIMGPVIPPKGVKRAARREVRFVVEKGDAGLR
jgi:F-box and leucine-rich repeat protein 7